MFALFSHQLSGPWCGVGRFTTHRMARLCDRPVSYHIGSIRAGRQATWWETGGVTRYLLDISYLYNDNCVIYYSPRYGGTGQSRARLFGAVGGVLLTLMPSSLIGWSPWWLCGCCILAAAGFFILDAHHMKSLGTRVLNSVGIALSLLFSLIVLIEICYSVHPGCLFICG